MFSHISARSLVAGAATLALLTAACAQAQETSITVQGGGSSFAAPAHQAWIADYRDIAPTVDITYASIGSGDGISGFLNGSLDFGATDAPLDAAQEASVPGGAIHVPVTAGMVAVAYNLPGNLEGELRLPRTVLGDIFAGKLTAWNDPRLVAANPELDLPAQSIQIVARQDGSGTTYAFTNHLTEISQSWRDAGRGVAYLSSWPNSTMRARGNEGVAATIQRSEGSIGYVEYGLARQIGLALAAVENASGAFVAPSAASGAAAIATADLPRDMKINLPDPAGAQSYPIVTFTWQLLRRNSGNPEMDQTTRDFSRWAVTDGQAAAEALGYVPLPANVADLATSALGAGL